jgi:hypothetical protein
LGCVDAACVPPAVPAGQLDLPSLVQQLSTQLQYCKSMHLSKRSGVQKLLR